ncbi:MAG: 5'-3' exonuclease H3TH domain-containing protein, partial [Bacteroidales bacterium]
MSDSSDRKLFLLDAYALIFRSYYAFIRNPRINSKGLNTSAVFGFMLTLEEILQKQDPSHIAVVFDPPGPTFRHEIYKEYKANRDATPEDIKLAVPYIKGILEAYGIPVYESEGFEADDLIGTMSRQAADIGYRTYMMTSDKDFMQLVTDKVMMYKPAARGGPAEVMGPEEVCRKFGIDEPAQVIDILALMGDTADNIPGAPGIGPKTAQKLIAEYGSVEKLIENSHLLKGKQKEIIENNREEILFSKRLVTIETNVPFELKEKEIVRKEMDRERLKELFGELEFRSMAEKMDIDMDKPYVGVAGKLAGADNRQGTLFDTGSTAVKACAGIETLSERDHEYRRLESGDEIKELADTLNKLDEFCFDTETSSIKPLESELVAVSFSW